MTTKDAIIELIRKLPDDVTVDGVMQELYVRRSIEEGLRELDEGKGIPHDEVKQRLAKWLE
jgi:predicted transcriptional regulator